MIRICDICDSKNRVNSVYLPYDRKTDAAGSMEDIGESYDLCERCELRILKSVFHKRYKNEVFNINVDIIDNIKRRIHETSIKDIKL